ncbi:60S ribosomal protein L3 [Batrachochytrium dendrobatidis]|nr:60S ribosomal protein L3 [Batrachochytrium dendrobatidis]
MRKKLQRKMDVCMTQMQDSSWNQREKGFKALLRLMATFTSEERSVFAIVQREQNCNLQHLLFQQLKLRMSPAMAYDVKISNQVASVLEMLQGVALLHYDSKLKAGAKQNMMLLLTFLPSKSTVVAIAAIEAVQGILIDSSQNIRIFEQIGGVPVVCETLKSKHVSEAVLHKCIELLYLYLQPEDKNPDRAVGEIIFSKSVELKRESITKLLGPGFVKKLMNIST